MKMSLQNKLYLYKITYGPEVDPNDGRTVRKVLRSINESLTNVYGKIMNCEQTYMLAAHRVE
jgi:hypothetical protein